MRRADRLFRIVEFLKARRNVVTAKVLANELEVSLRTIYRDIADLNASGIPILGEAGVGYMLSKDHKVQPLMFSLEEIDALMLGAEMVKSWGDSSLAKSAGQAIDKLTSTLPETLQASSARSVLFSMPSKAKHSAAISIDFTGLRHAIRSKNKLNFDYQNEQQEHSNRTVRPLCLIFFSPIWLLLAWCEKRNDFRNFRLDRMQTLNVVDEHFSDEKGKRLYDYCVLNGYSTNHL